MRERRFCTGSAFLFVLMLVGVLLVGCDSVEERQKRASDLMQGLERTASGVVTETVGQIKGVVDSGKSAAGAVQEGVADIKRRVDAVEAGVKKIKEGKKLIDEGLGNNSPGQDQADPQD